MHITRVTLRRYHGARRLVGGAGDADRGACAALGALGEVLSARPLDEDWQAVLADAILKSVPLICELATRQQVRDVRHLAMLRHAQHMLISSCVPVAPSSAFFSPA